MSKKYIDLIAEYTKDGKVTPKIIKWEDGRNYEIDRVSDIRKAASLKSGGIGIRYTCFIKSKQIYLFKDEDMWFMETNRE